MSMNMYCEKYKVVESGSVIPFDGDCTTEMQLVITEDFTIKLRIIFDENGQERDILKSVNEKENVVEYRCVNFGSGAGTIEPLSLATVGGKAVYIHLWAQRLSPKNNTRRIDYTVFLER